MIISGLLLLAIAIVTLWICMPGRQATKKWFLRGGTDVLAAIFIVSCLGIGLAILVIGAAEI